MAGEAEHGLSGRDTRSYQVTFQAVPWGEESGPIAAAAASPEPEVPRVPIALARPAADRHFRPRPPSFSLRLGAASSPAFCPHLADSQVLAPRPGRGRRRAGKNAAPCLRLGALPSFPAFIPESYPVPWLPAVVFQLFVWRCRRPDQPLPTPITSVVMSQPGVPASGGAPTGLQTQNGAASALGSPYTNGKYRLGTGAGRSEGPSPS